MSALSHQSRYIDPRAPAHWHDLSLEERGSILKHPDIVHLKEIRDQLSTDVEELYGSMKRAEGTDQNNNFRRKRILEITPRNHARLSLNYA
jgi:hypothetical protein